MHAQCGYSNDDSHGFEDVVCNPPSGSSYDNDKNQKRPYR
jgi:hypothetical protein